MYDEDLLIRGAKKMGIKLTNPQIEKFGLYYHLLVEWNKTLNLTRITEGEEIITDHFLDSISPVKFLEFGPGVHFCDVGTGAGFPGIPLKIIFPRARLTLIDSKKRRIYFLKRVIKELGLDDVFIYHGRAEDIAREKEHRERYDVVLARALAPMNVLVELALPFAALGGKLVAYKGKKVWQELEEAQAAITLMGGKRERVGKINLPFSDKNRYIVVINKETLTPFKFPRKAGVPKKRPIIKAEASG
ncbi:MAG: 16S rRNA (guanine(527)-N(7))-methyltransferase RsmG [Candidatus Syntrophonatronum acetioxidans]|uniref:Ribosomal RNA small subunit methyltransferase G n=1 Tax=Candidatus Syntrophonatronum acetioxidans TaxID=1795816 RepID=A0A424YB77_9FIRM|nr:MAG: 16S rRNA (guanine(527)-N(7))-methyltransferase RsmG [Candidatus Syntrophonatronum acetioxidans]